MNRNVRASLTLLLLAFAPAYAAHADILFESGTLGPTGIFIHEINGGTEPGGAVVSDFVFDGVRFELTQPAITLRIGGHFVADPRVDDSFFGAIVKLDDVMDFPDSGNLSTPDVLGATLLTFPNPSAEVFGDLQLNLDRGWYALVYGSGLFGATGSGGMLLNNADIGDPSYIAHQPGPGFGWGNLSPIFHNFRFVVEGIVVPEPMALAILPITLVVVLRIRCRTYRQIRRAIIELSSHERSRHAHSALILLPAAYKTRICTYGAQMLREDLSPT
jgi:hypothetical protein